ncbi:MAG TPA: excinuclease ABC subunit UvrB [Candidatus Kapabacteria bacterium]|nr:excinuclease ABC subunit UvrB [Candidatus Kapabacteria bacterium]
MDFQISSEYSPSGDQPQAIAQLTEGLKRGDKYQTLLGITGSGKTFTISHVIQNLGRPTLIMSHNKTLAAQLYAEFKRFFPKNAVEFFISYYDYYQPEAYIPSSDTYIEKDSSINEEIDRLRLKATSALLSGRRDVIIIASVSCIYSIGTPEDYSRGVVRVRKGETIVRDDLLRALTEILYTRNDIEFVRGTFRVRGDVVDIFPAYESDIAIRLEFFGDEIERIYSIDCVTAERIETLDSADIFPAKHFVTTAPQIEEAVVNIKDELYHRLKELHEEGKLLEAQRLEQRTLYDIEMMKELGYCSGIENYSRHLTGRKPGERPSCLFDYFPKDYLLIIDESHQTIPQIRAMYNGDRARKKTLVEYGFRLPSALDNRPLTFDEYETLVNQAVFVSATPGDYELQKSNGVFVEQIIRPTGLLDPELEVRPVKHQIDDLVGEIRDRVKLKERVLITTLTKRMAEDLTEYLQDMNFKVEYIHSDVDSLSRVDILRGLRVGDFDVLVGVNLLREGLDLPEVSLVAILDADKEGFLRSARSLFQIAGRTARNERGKVIMYADRITDSMKQLIDETKRRREVQIAYNTAHGIEPHTIYKSMEEILSGTLIADLKTRRDAKDEAKNRSSSIAAEPMFKYLTPDQKTDLIEQLKQEMRTAAKDLEFERAAMLRDEIQRLTEAVEGGK